MPGEDDRRRFPFYNPDEIQRTTREGPVELGGIFSLQFFSGAASFLRHGWLNDDHIWNFFNLFFQGWRRCRYRRDFGTKLG